MRADRLPFHAAVYIGRFQPLHNGHLALLRRCLALAPLCIVVVGSAYQARTPKNPFTWTERAQLIMDAMLPEDRARLRILPMRDYYNLQRWTSAVRQGVADLLAQEGLAAEGFAEEGVASAGQPQPASVVLVGHFKDPTSDYLSNFPGWALGSVDRIFAVDGTQLRDHLFRGANEGFEVNLEGISHQVPVATVQFLRAWLQGPHFDRLQNEWQMLYDYHRAWSRAPYPPVFVTVDAVVHCAGHVLLIRRAHAPGVGLLAVPGGFIEQRETTLQSCLRELQEETHLAVPEDTLRHSLKANAVFDHPDRSLRGRTITHAFFFDLGEGELPSVRADDDAQAVEWMAADQLLAVEDQFHDDHFHMLDHFLRLTGA